MLNFWRKYRLTLILRLVMFLLLSLILAYGKKYCHNSPTIYEDALKTSVMRAIKGASANIFELKDNLKEHIKTGLEDAERSKKIKTLQDKLDSITHHFDLMLNSISVDTSFDEEEFANLSREKYELEEELSKLRNNELSDLQKVKMEELYSLIDLVGDYLPEYDDVIVRKCINRILVKNKNEIEITFEDVVKVLQTIA